MFFSCLFLQIKAKNFVFLFFFHRSALSKIEFFEQTKRNQSHNQEQNRQRNIIHIYKVKCIAQTTRNVCWSIVVQRLEIYSINQSRRKVHHWIDSFHAGKFLWLNLFRFFSSLKFIQIATEFSHFRQSIVIKWWKKKRFANKLLYRDGGMKIKCKNVDVKHIQISTLGQAWKRLDHESIRAVYSVSVYHVSYNAHSLVAILQLIIIFFFSPPHTWSALLLFIFLPWIKWRISKIDFQRSMFHAEHVRSSHWPPTRIWFLLTLLWSKQKKIFNFIWITYFNKRICDRNSKSKTFC